MATGALAAPTAIEYDSASRRPAFVDELVQLVQYRGLLRLLISNSIKTRYKRSVLGVVWTLLNPLFTMLVVSFAFAHIFKATLPFYSVYVLTGLLLWNLFTQTTVSSMYQLVWGGSLLKRVYIPRSIFAVSATGNGLFNVLLALIPLAGIMLLTGAPFHRNLWFLPVALLINGMFALGVSLFLSTLAVYFVDVVDMYQILISALFYLTPIIYPREMLPPEWAWYVNLNPMYSMIELARRPICEGLLPGPYTFAAALASATIALAIGWFVFTRHAEHFAYRI
jgi:ABC-2 type transport system permease protein